MNSKLKDNEVSNLLSQAELRSNISIVEPIIPTPTKVFEVGVIAKSINTNATLTYIIAVTQLDTLVDEAELTALQNAWTGKSYWLQTYSDTITQEMVDALTVNVTTIFFTATASGIMGDITVNFDGIKFYNLKTATPWQDENLKNLVLKENIGAFADPEDDGKSLYSLLSFLVNYPVCTQQATINNPLFTSVFRSKSQRDVLMQNSFSFWMQSKETTELWDIYVAGRQAQGAYSYFILKYEVQNIINTFIHEGRNYTNANLSILDSRIALKMGNLKLEGVIGGYAITFVPTQLQSTSDRVKGYVQGFTVDFDEEYRIALISVLITGNTGV